MTKRQKKDLQRIIIALVLFVPLFIVEHMGLLDQLPYRWMPLVICLVPYLIVGHDVILKAWHNIKNGQVFDENFLMMIATFGAFVVSEYIEAVAVMLFYQVGELFQSYAVGKSRESITALMEICPEYANLEVDGELEEVDPDDVEIDSIIVIKPGEKVPLDGVVIEGESFLDTSALTGESVPRKVNTGEDIISGCINGNGTLRVRVTKEFDDSTVSKILELVENATNKKAKVENFITRFAKYYTPFVTISALLLAILPPVILQDNWLVWLERACTFLVVSCPCALVISVPLGFFGGIGAASKEGVLVKGSNYLELLSELDIVVFDKTGTLTNGVFEVTEVFSNTYNKEEFLQLAASVERFSTHPIAESICAANTLELLDTTGVEEISGHGLSGKVNIEKISDSNISGTVGVEKTSGHDINGKTDVSTRSVSSEAGTEELSGHSAGGNEMVVLAGNYKLMRKNQIPCEMYTGNGTVVYIAVNGKFAGYIVISDTIKNGASDAVAGLKKRGVSKTVMLTGDRKETALSVAKELGVDEVYYELLPADKVEQVETLLQQVGEKKKLAFVGDGINDAPVLARADVGIAMGSLGSDAAIEAADIVIMDDDIRKISNVMKISKKTMTIVKENIVFALGVKGLVLILGAIGKASMWAAVFADVGVAVIAILNSMRMLKNKK